MITTNGRINRRTYFVLNCLLLFVFLVWFCISILLLKFVSIDGLLDIVAGLLNFVILFGFLYFMVCIFIKRLHDTGLSGIYALLLLIPYVSLAFLFVPGKESKNEFGKKPKPGIDYKALTT